MNEELKEGRVGGLDWTEPDILAISSLEQLSGTHAATSSVILSRPVVHWHVVSERPQLAAGTAVAKHGIYFHAC